MPDPDIDDLKRRMDGAVEVLKDEFGGLRTGRSSPALLEPVQVGLVWVILCVTDLVFPAALCPAGQWFIPLGWGW